MLRRFAGTAAAAALLLVGLAAPAHASPMIVGDWKAVDIDGSNMKMTIYSDYSTEALDDDATVCGGGWAKIYGPGDYVPTLRRLYVKWTVHCASGPYLGPYYIQMDWDGADTIYDSIGVVWHRV